MKEQILTSRYAKALVRLSYDEKIIPQVREDLNKFLEIVHRDGGFFLWLADDELTHSKRCALLDDVANKIGISALVVKFLKFLIERERIKYIAQIARAFNELSDEIEGIVRGRLIATEKGFGEKVRTSIEAFFAKKMGKKVMLTVKEDKSILGGLVLLMKDKVYDASIQRALTNIKETLCQ